MDAPLTVAELAQNAEQTENKVEMYTKHIEYLEEVVSELKTTVQHLEATILQKDNHIQELTDKQRSRSGVASRSVHSRFTRSVDRSKERELSEQIVSLELQLRDKEKESRVKQQTISELMKKLKQAAVKEQDRRDSFDKKCLADHHFKQVLTSHSELSLKYEQLLKDFQEAQSQLDAKDTAFNTLLQHCTAFEKQSQRLYQHNLTLQSDLKQLLNT